MVDTNLASDWNLPLTQDQLDALDLGPAPLPIPQMPDTPSPGGFRGFAQRFGASYQPVAINPYASNGDQFGQALVQGIAGSIAGRGRNDLAAQRDAAVKKYNADVEDVKSRNDRISQAARDLRLGHIKQAEDTNAAAAKAANATPDTPDYAAAIDQPTANWLMTYGGAPASRLPDLLAGKVTKGEMQQWRELASARKPSAAERAKAGGADLPDINYQGYVKQTPFTNKDYINIDGPDFKDKAARNAAIAWARANGVPTVNQKQSDQFDLLRGVKQNYDVIGQTITPHLAGDVNMVSPDGKTTAVIPREEAFAKFQQGWEPTDKQSGWTPAQGVGNLWGEMSGRSADLSSYKTLKDNALTSMKAVTNGGSGIRFSRDLIGLATERNLPDELKDPAATGIGKISNLYKQFRDIEGGILPASGTLASQRSAALSGASAPASADSPAARRSGAVSGALNPAEQQLVDYLKAKNVLDPGNIRTYLTQHGALVKAGSINTSRVLSAMGAQ